MSRADARPKEKTLLGQKRWGWAAAAAGLFIIGLAAFWLLRDYGLNNMRAREETSERFRINYLNVEDKPAQAYLYQPSESNLIIVWVQKST